NRTVTCTGCEGLPNRRATWGTSGRSFAAGRPAPSRAPPHVFSSSTSCFGFRLRAIVDTSNRALHVTANAMAQPVPFTFLDDFVARLVAALLESAHVAREVGVGSTNGPLRFVSRLHDRARCLRWRRRW